MCDFAGGWGEKDCTTLRELLPRRVTVDERFPHPLNMTCAIAWGFQSWPDHGDDPGFVYGADVREQHRRAGLRVDLRRRVQAELRPYKLTIWGNSETVGYGRYVVKHAGPQNYSPLTKPDTFPRTCQKAIDIIRGKEHTP